MKLRLAVLISFLLMASAASAISMTAESFESTKGQINAMKPGENSALDSLRSQFADDVLELDLEDTGKTLTIAMKDGNVEKIVDGSTGEATVKIKTSEKALNNIVKAKDPAKEAVTAINQEEIEVELIDAGIFRRLMFWLMKLAARIITIFL